MLSYFKVAVFIENEHCDWLTENEQNIPITQLSLGIAVFKPLYNLDNLYPMQL